MNDAAGTGIGSWVTTAGLAGVPGPDLLRGSTAITDSAAPEAVIPAIHAAGGDVLKLIGDGTLAIFTADATATACRRALEAERLARQRIKALNERRAADGLPLTQACPGLHLGEVFHGDIGSQERLDFTVIGPAVDEASRIAAMCRSADRAVLLSSAFAAAAADADRALFVPVGRYALRGVGRAQELVHPGAADGPAQKPWLSAGQEPPAAPGRALQGSVLRGSAVRRGAQDGAQGGFPARGVPSGKGGRKRGTALRLARLLVPCTRHSDRPAGGRAGQGRAGVFGHGRRTAGMPPPPPPRQGPRPTMRRRRPGSCAPCGMRRPDAGSAGAPCSAGSPRTRCRGRRRADPLSPPPQHFR